MTCIGHSCCFYCRLKPSATRGAQTWTRKTKRKRFSFTTLFIFSSFSFLRDANTLRHGRRSAVLAVSSEGYLSSPPPSSPLCSSSSLWHPEHINIRERGNHRERTVNVFLAPRRFKSASIVYNVRLPHCIYSYKVFSFAYPLKQIPIGGDCHQHHNVAFFIDPPTQQLTPRQKVVGSTPHGAIVITPEL